MSRHRRITVRRRLLRFTREPRAGWIPYLEGVLAARARPAGLTATRARQKLDWADLVLIWGKTQLAHRVSTHFTAARNRKVVTAATRGIGGLLDAGTTHLTRKKSVGELAL